MQNEPSRKQNGGTESRLARLEATAEHLLTDVRELRADFRMVIGLQIATLGMIVTVALGTAALIVKVFGGS